MTSTEALNEIKVAQELLAIEIGLLLLKYRRKITIRYYGSSGIFKVLDNDTEVMYQNKDMREIKRFISICATI